MSVAGPAGLEIAPLEWPSDTASCPGVRAAGVLLGSVPLHLPALWSARHQTVPERIAGILTVRDSGA